MPTYNFKPLIKWTGAKRYAAAMLTSMMPRFTGDYVEPFVGGGSVARCVFDKMAPQQMRLSDACPHLINVWKSFANTPESLVADYRSLWEKLSTADDKDAFYRSVRNRFNKTADACAFLFLVRTSFNGLIRFNSSGEFNAPFHHGRPGIHPDALASLVAEWSLFLARAFGPQPCGIGMSFECLDFEQVTCGPDDFMFLDPPYGNGTHIFGFDKSRFWEWVAALKCRWIVTYDEPVPVAYAGVTPMPRCVSGFGKLKLNGSTAIREAAYFNFPLGEAIGF